MLFFPFSVSDVISFFSSLLSLDFSSLTSYQQVILLLLSNAYFFGFWFFILYFTLKSLNWVYERLF